MQCSIENLNFLGYLADNPRINAFGAHSLIWILVNGRRLHVQWWATMRCRLLRSCHFPMHARTLILGNILATRVNNVIQQDGVVEICLRFPTKDDFGSLKFIPISFLPSEAFLPLPPWWTFTKYYHGAQTQVPMYPQIWSWIVYGRQTSEGLQRGYARQKFGKNYLIQFSFVTHEKERDKMEGIIPLLATSTHISFPSH